MLSGEIAHKNHHYYYYYSGTTDVERNSFKKSGLQLICSESEKIFPIRQLIVD